MPGMIALLAALALASPPHLVVSSPSTSAVVVRGTGFAASERVTVRVIGLRIVRRIVTTTATGRFRVRMARPTPLACGRLIVRARGVTGDAAVARLGPPECNPPGELSTG
jgi:hypothetical protein